MDKFLDFVKEADPKLHDCLQWDLSDRARALLEKVAQSYAIVAVREATDTPQLAPKMQADPGAEIFDGTPIDRVR